MKTNSSLCSGGWLESSGFPARQERRAHGGLRRAAHAVRQAAHLLRADPAPPCRLVRGHVGRQVRPRKHAGGSSVWPLAAQRHSRPTKRADARAERARGQGATPCPADPRAPRKRKRRALLYATAAGVALDKPPASGSNSRVQTDAAKLFCGKMGKDCADAAMQVQRARAVGCEQRRRSERR
jgi:hypothetical protein